MNEDKKNRLPPLEISDEAYAQRSDVWSPDMMGNSSTTSTEVNLVKCKACNILKTRMEAGKYPNGKIKIYTNESGKKWNGKICPDCNKNRVKNVMRAGRLGKNS